VAQPSSRAKTEVEITSVLFFGESAIHKVVLVSGTNQFFEMESEIRPQRYDPLLKIN
jgi:hypothetical protein